MSDDTTDEKVPTTLEDVVEESIEQPQVEEKPVDDSKSEEEKVIIHDPRIHEVTFNYRHVEDHLAFSGDTNPAHENPFHVENVLTSLVARRFLRPNYEIDSNEIEALRIEKGDTERKLKKNDLKKELTLNRFLGDITSFYLGNPIIFPGAEAMSYLENLIPAEEHVAKFHVDFMSPLIIDKFGTTEVVSTIECQESPLKKGYRKDYKITAKGTFLGEEVTILSMDVVTFSPEAVREEREYVQGEFNRLLDRTKKSTPLETYDEDLNVSERKYGSYSSSIDKQTQGSRQISAFATAALLPKLLIALADRYNQSLGDQASQEGNPKTQDKVRLGLIREYAGRELSEGTLDADRFDSRVEQLMEENLRIYNSQTAIFSRDLMLATDQDFNLNVVLTGHRPKTGRLDFVATGHQGSEFGWTGKFPYFIREKLVLAGEGYAMEQPLFNVPLMKYVLDKGIDLRTLKPFEKKTD
ncbi:hypothetical protein ACFLZB_02495 [Nanoarchaeota archaeon]